jgi:hypothetical protein
MVRVLNHIESIVSVAADKAARVLSPPMSPSTGVQGGFFSGPNSPANRSQGTPKSFELLRATIARLGSPPAAFFDAEEDGERSPTPDSLMSDATGAEVAHLQEPEAMIGVPVVKPAPPLGDVAVVRPVALRPRSPPEIGEEVGGEEFRVFRHIGVACRASVYLVS